MASDYKYAVKETYTGTENTGAILHADKVVWESTEELKFTLRPKGRKGVSCVKSEGTGIPGGVRNSKYKGPEVGKGLVCLMNKG